MNPREMDLALRKQRLQLKSEALRSSIGEHALALSPAFAAADTARRGWLWLKSHPEWVAGGGALLIALRPRTVIRWARRAFGAFRAWRRLRSWADGRLASLGS